MIQENNFNLIVKNGLLKQFIDYVEVNPKTTKCYLNNIKVFLRWLKDNQIQHPTREDILEYKSYLNSTNYSIGTKNQYLRAVKQLFNWLDMEGFYKDISKNIKSYKVDTSIKAHEVFNEDDIKKILGGIDTSNLIGKRDYSIIMIALLGGLRVSEIANIDLQDIEIISNQMRIYVKRKKHNAKDTYIKVIDPLANSINDYLRARGNIKPNQPLFTSNSNRVNNERLTGDTISKIIKKHFKNSGYNSTKLVAHSLRSTSATLLFKSGADLYEVQQHLQHKSPTTTEIYLHINEKEKAKSEQKIYNQIFNIKENKVNKLMIDINKLSIEEKKDLFNQLSDSLRITNTGN